MADAGQTIIIKKIKKGGHGHHGGAWKVAYADFVTAMMAFFLLMWLLNATEAENLAGLADYFAPTVGVQGEMGIGFRGGKSALSKGIGADKNTNRGIVFGGMPSGPIMKVTEKFELVTDQAETEKILINTGGKEDAETDADEASYQEMAEAVESFINESVEESEIQSSVTVTVTPEGVEVQINDTQHDSMFKKNSAILEPRITKVLSKLAEIIKHMPNYLSITGHTSSTPIVGKANYGNWELSADRANSTRRFLVASGVQSEQIARVVGRADNSPFDTRHPELPINNRITIVLLRQSLLPSHKQSAPAGVFLDPTSRDAKTLTNPEEVKKEDEVEEEKSYDQDTEIKGVIEEIESGEEEMDENDPFKNLGIPSVSGDVSNDNSSVSNEVIFDTEGSKEKQNIQPVQEEKSDIQKSIEQFNKEMNQSSSQ